MNLNIFKYLGAAMSIAGALSNAQPNSVQSYAKLFSQVALIVSPSLANDKNFQSVNNLLSAVDAATASGQPGQVASVGFYNNGKQLYLNMTVSATP